MNQVAGAWGRAIEVPGTNALNRFGAAAINAISCTAPGRCTAAGFYTDSNNNTSQAFVVSETG